MSRRQPWPVRLYRRAAWTIGDRPADAADALALAICHVWRGGTWERIAAAVRRAR